MVYVPFLVLDRMTGVVLEAMGMARYNLVKTFLLVVVNIAGNAIALYYFHSMAGVAAVSIVAALTGFGVGLFFLIRKGGLRFPLTFFKQRKAVTPVTENN
jgi:Na+-driven multidrug efflux pump